MDCALKKQRDKAEAVTSLIIDLLRGFTPAEAYGILETTKFLLHEKTKHAAAITDYAGENNNGMSHIGIAMGSNLNEALKDFLEQVKNETNKAGQTKNH